VLSLCLLLLYSCSVVVLVMRLFSIFSFFLPSCRRRDTAFQVIHYAGPVEYEVAKFCERNKDTIFNDLVETMQCSEDPFIVNLFPEDTKMKQKKRPTTAGFKIKVLTRIFCYVFCFFVVVLASCWCG